MNRPATIVIVGASLAGAKAAEALRQEGFDGRVLLLGEEADRPYERPPLSKDYLRGESERAKIYVHDEGFYADQDIELRTSSRVVALDLAQREVILEGGERFGFGELLLATGSAPRRLPIPGGELGGVRYLRTVDDSDDLHGAIQRASRVVVVGAGWIGAEVAASARQMGREVALLEVTSVPLERVLGKEVGAIYRDLHADHGVELHLGTGVECFRGTDTVEEVRTADGRSIPADLVVVGVGVAPRVELAEGAALDVADGVVVDEYLRTSAAGIYAAGDVAAAWHPLLGSRIRVEHWANALNQGPVAAKNMLGIRTPYDRIPYFFSDQHDLGMEYSGYASPNDQVVFRGEPAKREFIAFWLRDGKVVAGMNANVWDVVEPIQALIRAQRPVDIERLTNPAVPLEQLANEV